MKIFQAKSQFEKAMNSKQLISNYKALDTCVTL